MRRSPDTYTSRRFLKWRLSALIPYMIALRWASFSAIGWPSALGYSIGAAAGAGRVIAGLLRAAQRRARFPPSYHTLRSRSTSGRSCEKREHVSCQSSGNFKIIRCSRASGRSNSALQLVRPLLPTVEDCDDLQTVATDAVGHQIRGFPAPRARVCPAVAPVFPGQAARRGDPRWRGW